MTAAPANYVLRGLLRSGAGTIAGDYLFGEFDRHGHSILGNFAGPTYGQVENLMDLRNEFMNGLTKGKWAPFAAGALHEARGNLPFVDMWWTFKAFDYLVTYRLLEWLNPATCGGTSRSRSASAGSNTGCGRARWRENHNGAQLHPVLRWLDADGSRHPAIWPRPHQGVST